MDPEALPPGRSEGRSKAGRRAVLAAVGLLVLLALLGLLALPFLTVRADGTAARADLAAALDALRDGDLSLAQERVTSARARVGSATAAANGLSADIVAALPVAGDAVDDVRLIVGALDDAVSIAELGVQVYPEVLGSDATLVQGGTVDLSALASVTDVAAQVREHLEGAHSALDDVSGDSWLIGPALADARDAALRQIVPLESTIERYQPILDVLPSLLGTQGPRNYLVAVMNPAELRWSGGATLSLAPMSFDQGQLTFGDAGNTFDLTDSNEDIAWEPVPGNPWHRNVADPIPLVNATFSPNWTTSGEELLRAWEVTSGDRYDALLVIDLPAIADLFEITGPLDVPKYGTLTAANFVETLAGSYDKYPQADERRELNAAIIPALRAKLFEGGKFVQKAQSLLASAGERRFVVYFRDPAEQAALGDLGVAGDLSTTAQDYIGVFSQNTNASKVDYWHKRSISSDVTVNPDGSASVTLRVSTENDTPPFTRPGDDTQRGYFTRWSIPFIAAYLPIGAELATTTLDGVPLQLSLLTERERPLVATPITLEPDATRVLEYTYRVPQAAVVTADGLEYTVDIDPQSMVNPTRLALTVHLPAGYSVEDVPDGWTASGGAYVYEAELGPAMRLTLTATP